MESTLRGVGVQAVEEDWSIEPDAVRHGLAWPSMAASHRRMGSAHHVCVIHGLGASNMQEGSRLAVLVDGIHPTGCGGSGGGGGLVY